MIIPVSVLPKHLATAKVFPNFIALIAALPAAQHSGKFAIYFDSSENKNVVCASNGALWQEMGEAIVLYSIPTTNLVWAYSVSRRLISSYTGP